MNIARFLTTSFLTVVLLSWGTADAATTQWHGFDRNDFTVDDRPCYVVRPHEAAKGRPWVWRARFPDFHPEVDQILLEQGFHVAYVNTDDMLGSDEALDHWDRFYESVRQRYDLAEKAALEAVSRGGLFAYRWAARHPDRVACIYADTPVCDFKSWPLGNGVGIGHQPTWQNLLAKYGLTEAEALEYKQNPIDVLKPIADAGVPILHIVSENDRVVPPAENTYLLQQRYWQLGGRMRVMSVEEGTVESNGHHFPHPDPLMPAEFIVNHTIGPGDWFTLRDGLDNCRFQFERHKRGRVAFLGGSITNMNGWRDKVCQEIQRRFPDTEFDFVNAGIPSTGSTPGAFRLERDVLGRGAVDLLFVEAAVNDSTNLRTPIEMVRGMEGIVRHARRAKPNIDVVIMHFVDPSKIDDYNHGREPMVIARHEQVARHYGVPSINLALEVTQRINAGEFTWNDDFKDLHPSPFGHELYAETITRLLNEAWSTPLPADAKLTAHSLREPLDPYCYDRGRLVAVSRAELDDAWKLNPQWEPTDKIGTRQGFVRVPMLVADRPGATLHFPFTGRAVGVFVAAGADAGVIEYRIDDGPWKTRDLFTQWSQHLHIPWAHVLEAELADQPHQLTIRVAETQNPASQGHAARIVHLLVNE